VGGLRPGEAFPSVVRLLFLDYLCALRTVSSRLTGFFPERRC